MRLEIRKRVSPRPFAESGADLDGLVHSMDGARDRPRIIIRTLKVHDRISSLGYPLTVWPNVHRLLDTALVPALQ